MPNHIVIDEGQHAGMDCLIGLPEKPNGAAIILSMSVWGHNADFETIVDYFASLGFACIAPNLFWRLGRGHAVEYDFSKLDAIKVKMDASSDGAGAADLVAARNYLLKHATFDKAGLVGWCYGGRIACMFSSRTEFDAVVGVYPTNLETCLEVSEDMCTETQIHLAEIEQFAAFEDAVERIEAAYAPLPLAECHIYPAVQHGFDFSPPHPSFDHAAARLCDTRTALFLDQRLVYSAV